jgi:3',5'-cyclic-AMP phosphodiesterase
VSEALLAQLSDPHLRVGAGDREAAQALAAAVRSVLALRPAPDAVVVTGDIANSAAAAEYERARELLAPLSMPVHVLPGNHDDRDALREFFAPPGLDSEAGAPLQYTVPVGELRLVVCDTTRPGYDDGALDGGRLGWLKAQLAVEPAVPTVIAMHHPPITIGLPALDAIALAQSDRLALAELLPRAPQVRRVIAGHVHRTAFGTVGGCAVVACTSCHEQALLEIGMPELAFVDEPPAFAVHAAVDGGVVSHIQPIF